MKILLTIAALFVLTTAQSAVAIYKNKLTRIRTGSGFTIKTSISGAAVVNVQTGEVTRIEADATSSLSGVRQMLSL